jgi:hypothetical protein
MIVINISKMIPKDNPYAELLLNIIALVRHCEITVSMNKKFINLECSLNSGW